ncbi:MAG: hypothetical protein AAFY88_00120 [Acidobacteriota bacterium]
MSHPESTPSETSEAPRNLLSRLGDLLRRPFGGPKDPARPSPARGASKKKGKKGNPNIYPLY